MPKHLNVLVQEPFESGGEMKTSYTKVGVAFPREKGEGLNFKITMGTSISGDLVVFPPRDQEYS
ncbi:hypothetical protein FV139_14250 [Parahaliea maris]|uniref:Uncharacterized protein n=1 Tax=Parahaliea maris TaxID=2716870 RepID=A0A5C8ZXF1_9GAMM|nr:hypothetical protein [Parahaliea maris]TXS91891.1 hypothetical protein FV139_14250 [Parahaliea maris]